jgi:ribose 5-phosphate isomerase B
MGTPEVTARRFDFITEAEARQIEPGSTVELDGAGRVTPLALETLATRGVTVIQHDSPSAALPGDLAPPAVVNRVAIGSDHGGVALKAALIDYLRSLGTVVTDCGTHGTRPVDYPDIARAVSELVARQEVEGGIVIDGSGLGSAIAANKVRGIRAAMCTTPTLARYAREHNGANVLTLGAALVDTATAQEIVRAWLTTPMREERYIRRLLKIRRLEDRI